MKPGSRGPHGELGSGDTASQLCQTGIELAVAGISSCYSKLGNALAEPWESAPQLHCNFNCSQGNDESICTLPGCLLPLFQVSECAGFSTGNFTAILTTPKGMMTASACSISASERAKVQRRNEAGSIQTCVYGREIFVLIQSINGPFNTCLILGF
ncbi:hypothetical protein LX36DRAFT_251719 [Colletotrichum falcatum]|nr:hypothetical protein LX36DRAFT_251719 [Colletotrichum falcatum]